MLFSELHSIVNIHLRELHFARDNVVLVQVAQWLGTESGTQVHHGRVGSAGLCDLKILHMWRRLKKGVKILQWPPPTLEKGVNILHQYEKSEKRGSKIYNYNKNKGQNSTSLKMGVKILHAEK